MLPIVLLEFHLIFGEFLRNYITRNSLFPIILLTDPTELELNIPINFVYDIPPPTMGDQPDSNPMNVSFNGSCNI